MKGPINKVSPEINQQSRDFCCWIDEKIMCINHQIRQRNTNDDIDSHRAILFEYERRSNMFYENRTQQKYDL